MKLAKTIVPALAMALSLAGTCAAADYPTRAITVVNPFLPGGIVDLGFRPASDEMSKILGVTVVNSPQPGAGGVVATTKTVRAKPDGYTLLLGTDTFFLTNPVLREVRFTLEDVIPVHTFGVTPYALAVKKDDPRFSNVAEFVAYAKAHPGELSIGQTGMLSTGHVANALLQAKLGIEFKIIPFDGAIAAVSAVTSGHIDGVITEVLYNPEILGIGLLGDKSAEFPEVPTFRELGYDINWGSNFGLFAIKGTSAEIVETLSKAMSEATSRQNVIDNVRNLGMGANFLDHKTWPDLLNQRKQVVDEVIREGFLVPEKK